MARSRFDSRAISVAAPGSAELVAIPFATVTVYEAGTTTGLGQDMYDAAVSGAVKTNPFSADEAGGFEAFIDDNTPVKIKITAGGYPDQEFDYVYPISDPSNTSLQSLSVSRFLTLRGAVNAAMVNAMIALGILNIKFPEGVHSFTETVDWPVGASFEGCGYMATIIEWGGAPGDPDDPMETDGIIFRHVGPDPPDSPAYSHASFKGMGFRTAVAGVTAIRSYYGGVETFENLAFYGIAKPFHLEGGFGASLHRIRCFPYSANSCGGSWFGSMPHIEIVGYATKDPSDAEAIMTFFDVAAGAVSNLNFYSPRTIGIILEGDTQGMNFAIGTMTAVTDGVLIRQGAGTGSPQYNDFVGFNIDQPIVSGARIIEGGMTDFVKFNVTNTLDAAGNSPPAPGSGSAYGIVLADPVDVFNIGIFNSQYEQLGPACIFAQAGAANLRVGGIRCIRGETTPAGDAAILIAGGSSTDIQVSDSNLQNVTHSIVDQSSGPRREYLDNIYGEYPSITTPTGVTIRDRNTWVVDGVVIVGANPVISGTLTVQGDVALTAPWTAFTPTVTQGVSVTATVDRARYRLFGKQVTVQIQLSITSAGTSGQNIAIGIPSAIQSASTGAFAAIGTMQLLDNGTAMYCGVAVAFGATSIIAYRDGAASLPIGGDPSMALASGDKISLALSYEVA